MEPGIPGEAIHVKGPAMLLWWMLLYPFSAAVGAMIGYLVYLVIVLVPALFGVPKLGPILVLALVAGLASAGGAFVRIAGRLAPAVPTGVASAACGVAISGAVLWARHLHLTVALMVIVPLSLGALAGVAATYEREQKARLRAAKTKDAPAPDTP